MWTLQTCTTKPLVLVTFSHFHPSLVFIGNTAAKSTIRGTILINRSLPANVLLGWRWLRVTNAEVNQLRPLKVLHDRTLELILQNLHFIDWNRTFFKCEQMLDSLDGQNNNLCISIILSLLKIILIRLWQLKMVVFIYRYRCLNMCLSIAGLESHVIGFHLKIRCPCYKTLFICRSYLSPSLIV